MNKEEEDEKITWSCWLRTLFACSGAMLCFIFSGVTEAQSSTLLPQLKAKDSIIHVTPEEETWIASLGILMAPIASVVVGPTIDLIGRKKGLLFFYLDMGVGFTIIACATEVWHIYVGRCVCSFAIGMEVAAVVYFAETCTKKQRSVLLSIISASFTFGVSLTYFVGGYLPWNVASGVFALGCFLYFLIQLLAPESPAWLYKKGDIDASKRSLQRLGRSPSGILRELEMLRLSSKEQSEKFQFKVFLEPTVWKPFLIMCIFHILLNLSGVFHIMYYTLDFIERLGTSYDPLTVSIIISVTRVISCSTVGIYSTAYVGRKPATIVSSILMTLSFLSAGVYEYVFQDTPVGQKPYEWVPIVLLISNLVSGILAVAILPWLISGELFPLQIRGSMNGAVYVFGTSLMFVSIKLYAVCLEVFQMWGLLLVYSLGSFLAILFGIFVLPETQNKTLLEVERGFLPKNRRDIAPSPNAEATKNCGDTSQSEAGLERR
nr:PREDICTED: facilitated trehalose transporter Tret1-like isoform X1 [Bemisia tabaci]